MTISTFDGWAHYHATTFGLTNESDLGMMLSWEEPFAAAGFTLDELVEATVYLAGFAAPRNRWAHLEAIQSRIRGRRVAAHAAARSRVEAATDDWQCDFCVPFGAAGLVIVPHLRFVQGGEWLHPYPTFAVTCLCPRGERKASSFKAAEKPALSLSSYEGLNPNWREQIFRQREAARAMDAAARDAMGRDRMSGNLTALKESIGTRVGRGKRPERK